MPIKYCLGIFTNSTFTIITQNFILNDYIGQYISSNWFKHSLNSEELYLFIISYDNIAQINQLRLQTNFIHNIQDVITLANDSSHILGTFLFTYNDTKNYDLTPKIPIRILKSSITSEDIQMDLAFVIDNDRNILVYGPTIYL